MENFALPYLMPDEVVELDVKRTLHAICLTQTRILFRKKNEMVSIPYSKITAVEVTAKGLAFSGSHISIFAGGEHRIELASSEVGLEIYQCLIKKMA